MKRQTISAVLAVKNEEKIIATCLEHLAWVDEIIIIDNNSTDHTVEICKKYTKKIYAVKQKMLIPLLQNQGIRRATKEWIIVLDADVIVPKKAAEEIQKKINDLRPDGYYLPHKSCILGMPMKSSLWMHNVLKLFKRNHAFFAGKSAHEQITCSGQVSSIKTPLLHLCHPDFDTEVKKLNLYSSQDAQIIFDKQQGGFLKRKISKINLFHLIIQPVLYFMYRFFYKGGWRDGVRGYCVDVTMAFYLFFESSKVWEIEEKNKKIDKPF